MGNYFAIISKKNNDKAQFADIKKGRRGKHGHQNPKMN